MTKCFHAVVALSLLAATSGHADGGAILARRAINGLEVTIFASPVPPRAGPVDVSVLVQRDESAILDAEGESCLADTIKFPTGLAASLLHNEPQCGMDAGAPRSLQQQASLLCCHSLEVFRSV